MATGDTLSGDNTKLWILAADSDYSDIASDTASKYESEVTSFKESGGAKEVTSEAVFGGFIDLRKPQEQYELTFDIILRHGTSKRWHDLTTTDSKYMVVVQNVDPSGTLYYWESYNNVSVINLEKDFAADDNWRGTLTLKLSPTTAEGVLNIQVGDQDAASDSTYGVQAWA